MSKLFRSLLVLVAVLAFVSCNNPKLEAYQGDWYLNHAISDLDITVLGYDYEQNQDTTFTDSLTCFTLTGDNYLLVDGDTAGTYTYDQLEGTLSIHSDKFKSALGGDADGVDISQYIDGIDLENFVLSLNYTDKAAKCSMQKSGAGTIASYIPYSYELYVQLYFQRDKK